MDDRIAPFWEFVAAHRGDLDAMETYESPFWDELLEQLHEIHEGLFFEASVPGASPRELVLTAEGDTALFALVEAIAAQAPALPGWQVVALKPPMGFEFGMRYEGFELVPAQMHFMPLVNRDNPEVLGLRIAIPGYVEELEDECANGVLVVLDTALGERSAAKDIELVEVCALPEDPDEEGYIPLPQLMNYIEWRKHRLATRN
jgi:hypothetical protein